MILTPSGNIVLIDFERSVLVTSEQEKESMAAKMQEEADFLEHCPLAETDTLGPPSTFRDSTL